MLFKTLKLILICILCLDDLYRLDSGLKLNVHKKFRRRSARLLNVLWTFNQRPMSRDYLHLICNISSELFKVVMNIICVYRNKKKDSNPVHADVSFSYPLKTSESLWFYGVSKRYRNWTLEWNELRGKTMKPFLSVSEEWLLEASEVRVIFHSR